MGIKHLTWREKYYANPAIDWNHGVRWFSTCSTPPAHGACNW